MRTFTIFVLVFVLVLGLLYVNGPSASAEEETDASREHAALLEEYSQEGGARKYARRFLEFAERHAKAPEAAEALVWVLQKVRGADETTRALELLEKHHRQNPALGPACRYIAESRSEAAEPLLRLIAEQNPQRSVQAEAALQLAGLLDTEANVIEQLREQPELAPRVLQYYGKAYGAHLAALDPQALLAKREAAYERLRSSFADVPAQDTTMGAVADKALFAIRHLTVGRVAPDIEGEDIHGETFRLSDYRGKVVMLSFWGHW